MASSGKLYRIEEDPLKGRQLVATKNISAGELIIDEPALLTGPGYSGSGNYFTKQTSTCSTAPGSELSSGNSLGDHHVCLVCCINIPPSSRIVECPHCSLFLCSEFCQNHNQHSKNECLVFPKIRHVWEQRGNRSKKSLYNLILTIRGLFYKFRDPGKWDQIWILESKSEALKKAGAFYELQDVFNCLAWEMFSSSLNQDQDIPEINGNNINSSNSISTRTETVIESAQHCLGVLRINAFSNFSESYSREGLFFLSSLMSHQCFVNTDRQMQEGLPTDSISGEAFNGSKMVVRASVDIEKGEPITTTYLSLLYNTEERHRIMISNWLFICNCTRCQDPTEIGTFVGGHHRCHHTPTENSIIQSNMTTGILGNESCITGAEASLILEILKSRPKNLNEIRKIEDWLDQYDNGDLLHPNHSVFNHLKLFLCQYYGRHGQGIEELSSSQLNRKMLYCQQILSIYDKVASGIQMCRGVLLFELWLGLRKLQELQQLPNAIKTITSSGGIPVDENYITNVKRDALEIFKYALPNSSEESMYNVLQEEATDL